MARFPSAVRTASVVLASFIALGATVSGVSGLAGRGGAVNVEAAIPTLITGVFCMITVLAFMRRFGWWWIFGVLAAAGHFWAHSIALSHAREAASFGRLVGLFAVPILWVVLVAVMASTQPKKSASTA